MGCEWKEVPLGDVINLKRGYDLPSSTRLDGKYPIYSSSGLTGFHNDFRVKAPGVVTGRYGTLGQCFYIQEDFWPLNTTLYVEDFKNNDQKFIYYLLKSLDLSSFNDKSAVPGINRNHVHTYPVRLPNLAEQQTIAATLSCLDDKIELNNKINANLEAQAQAIFRSWFVDFEPFQDGEFVDSELGRIPKGWKADAVGNLCSVNTESYTPSDKWQYINYLDTSNVTANDMDEYQRLVCGIDQIPSRAKRKARNGDILYSLVRPIQRHYGIIHETPPNLLVSTGFSVIRSNIPYVCNEHIYISLTTDETIQRLQQIAETTTSTFPAIKPSDIASQLLVVPSETVGRSFCDIVRPLFQKISSNQKESRMLSTIRDTLLPKLISGELEVVQYG